MLVVGDKVIIKNSGGVYTTYLGFLSDHISAIDNEVLARYRYGALPTHEECSETSVFVIVYINRHGIWRDKTIALITNSEHAYMVDINSLELVCDNTPIEEGDIVEVSDSSGIYTKYDKPLLKCYDKIGGHNFWKYRFGKSYETLYGNKHPRFEVLCIVNHEMDKYEKIAILTDQRNTIMVSTRSLKKVASKTEVQEDSLF